MEGAQPTDPTSPARSNSSADVPGPPQPASTTDATSEAPPLDPSLLRPLRTTAFATELEQLGLDPDALPAISTLGQMQKLDVMELVAQSLGVECTHCHVSDSDYRAETPRKAVARVMWNDFVVGRRLGNEPLFCDSCHQGSPKILQRTHKRAVKAYMKQQYARLVDAQGQGTVCADCHGKPFQPRILDALTSAASTQAATAR